MTNKIFSCLILNVTNINIHSVIFLPDSSDNHRWIHGQKSCKIHRSVHLNNQWKLFSHFEEKRKKLGCDRRHTHVTCRKTTPTPNIVIEGQQWKKEEQWRIPLPLIFRPNWGPKGRKNVSWTPPPLRVWVTGTPPLISRSRSSTEEGLGRITI